MTTPNKSAQKVTLGAKGTYNGGEDWQYVLLNGKPIGEVARFSDGSIHIHNALKERGNQRELPRVKTKSAGAKLLAKDYISFVKSECDYWFSQAKAIGVKP
jgi:hypothetical protein